MNFSTTKPSKYYIYHYLNDRLTSEPNKDFKVLDLGCGTADLFLDLIKQYPNLRYFGIEPDAVSVQSAKELFGGLPNAQVMHDVVPPRKQQTHVKFDDFDMVISLSVLEHIKDLPSFLEYSVQCAKPGGEVIHLYDLGHALYPSSWKERLQVWLCNNNYMRRFIPENKIACYVFLDKVRPILNSFGAKEGRVTFHNMRSHVEFIKKSGEKVDENLLNLISTTEIEWAKLLPNEPYSKLRAKELLFPSVAVWFRK